MKTNMRKLTAVAALVTTLGCAEQPRRIRELETQGRAATRAELSSTLVDQVAVAELHHQYPHVPEQFIIAALNQRQRFIRGEAPLELIPLHLPRERIAASLAFVSIQNDSQDQLVVSEWLRRHDPLGQRYQAGLTTDEDLHACITREINTGWLVNVSQHPRLTTVFNTSPGSGVVQPWRRVIRRDHLSPLDHIAFKTNEVLYAAGMPRTIFLTAQINGGVRSQEHNRNLRGSSTNSAHLGFSAFDFNQHVYTVQSLDTNGTVVTANSTAALPTFLAALRIATTELAQADKLFVREHGGHFHVVPKVETR